MLKEKRIKFKNIGIYLLSLTASAVGILLNFFLARVLGANEYGKIQYLVSLVTTISQFLIFGLNSFLIREAKNEKHNGQISSICISLYFVITVFAVPIAFYVIKHYCSYTNDSFLLSIVVIIAAILMGVNTLIASFYQGSGKYRISIIFENLIPKLFLLTVSGIFFVTQNILELHKYYLYFYILIYLLIAIPFLIKLFKPIKIKLTSGEYASIFFFFGVTITYSLGNNLTKVLQGSLYQNIVALAVISVSLSLIGLIKVFTGVIDGMIKPIFAKKKREGDAEGLLSMYRFDTRMNCYIAIPLYLFFIVHAKKFLFFFGESYTVYPEILMIIAASDAISVLTGPNGTMLAMTGKEKYELFNGFLYFGIYILSAFIFSFNRIYGLCLALLAAQFFVNTAKYIELWVLYKKNPLDYKSILTIFICAAADFCCIFPLKYINNFWVWLCVGVPVGAILVVTNILLLSLYRRNDFKAFLNLSV